jgi:hypothetical protein
MLKMLEKLCMCDCHREGWDIMHFMACCDLCGEKYLTAAGELDTVRYKELEEKSK